MSKKRTALCLLLVMLLTCTMPQALAASNNYSDYVTEQMAERAYALNGLNLFRGDQNGFSLEKRATRLEGLVMLVRLLGEETTVNNGAFPHAFTDVPSWGSAYVGYGYKQGLTKGSSPTVFGATEYITANQYCTFVLRALGYSDTNGDFVWSAAAQKAAELGIITQTQLAELNNRVLIRGDMVEISYMALQAKLKNSNQPLYQKLISKNIFSEDAAKEAGLTSVSTNTAFTVSPPSVGIAVGGTASLTATPSAGVTWSSSNASVATVSSSGLVTAVGEGTATITAKNSDGKTAIVSITVTNNAIAETGITLDKPTLSLGVGANATLVVTVTPSNATSTAITWSSSNAGVAKVENGKVTAVSAGTATITAKSANGKTATCTVTVTNSAVLVTNITLEKTALSLTVGGTETITAYVSPANASSKTITWASSNPSVAKVENGKVTAVSAGTTTITAAASDGSGKKATVVITVTPSKTTVTQEKSSISGQYLLLWAQDEELALDVANGSSEQGTPLHLVPNNGSDWQRFNTVDHGDNRFTFSPMLAQNRHFDISVKSLPLYAGGRLQIWQDNGVGPCQTFIASKLSNGYYAIRPAYSPELAIQPDGDGANALVSLAAFDPDNKKQQWKLNRLGAANWKDDSAKPTQVSDGWYRLKSVSGNKSMDVAGNISENGALVGLYEDNNSNAQKFNVVNLGNNNMVLIAGTGANERALDINPVAAGTRTIIYDRNDSDCQRLQFFSEADGTFSIRLAANTSLALENENLALVAKPYTGASSQKWTLSATSAPNFSAANLPTVGVRLANFGADAYNKSDSPFANGNFYGQCTWYCWGRAREVTGIRLNTIHNAKTWLGELNTSGAQAVWDGSQPRANSIAVYSGGSYGSAGHVRYVEAVDGDTVYYTEANFAPFNNEIDDTDGVVRTKSVSAFSKSCIGYIYLN